MTSTDTGHETTRWVRVARGDVAELRMLVDERCQSDEQRSTLLRASADAMERQAARAGGDHELLATANATRALAAMDLPPLGEPLLRTTVTNLTARATNATTLNIAWDFSPTTPTALVSLAMRVVGPGVAETKQVTRALPTDPWPKTVDVTSNGFQTGAVYVVTAAVVDQLGPLPSAPQLHMRFLPTSTVQPPTLVPAKTHGIYRGLQLTWDVPATVPAEYVVTVAGLGPELTRRVPAGPAGQPQTWSIDGLVTGALYTVTVQSVSGGLLSLPAVTVISAGISGTPLAERFDALSGSPIAFVSPDLAALRKQAESQFDRVEAMASKLTYQALRDRAAAAAKDSLDLDGTIVALQQQVLTKSAAGQSLFNANLLSIIESLSETITDVGGIPTDIDVLQAIDGLADTVKDAAVMAAVLAWLASFDALEFWKGLIEAIFKDVASASRSFSHASAFIDSQYDVLQAAIVPFVEEQRANVEADIERLLAPLRAAVAGLVGATSSKVGEVFRAFDMPLNLAVTKDGESAIPDVNPTAKQLDRLSNLVDQVAEQLKAQVAAALDEVLDAASDAGREIVRAIVIAYIVAPVAAALIVAFLGGGIGAVIIAAALVIAAEAIVGLIIGWVTGPLQEQLDELLGLVAGARRTLSQTLERATGVNALVGTTDRVVATLNLLSTELQQLSDLLPAAAIQEAVGTLGDARDALVERATFAAQAAERAAGRANATAFDVVARTYAAPRRLRSSQMPGLDDRNLFAGGRILADLGELDQAIGDLLDPSPSTVALPISLASALDTTTALGQSQQWADFQRTGRALLDVLDTSEFDDSLPGMYRALLEGITVTPLATDPAGSLPLEIPITITHLGKSLTRVDVAANGRTPSDFPTFLNEPIFSTAANYLGGQTAGPTAPVGTNINAVPANSLVAQVYASLQGRFDPSLTWSQLKAIAVDVLPGQLARVAGNLTDADVSAVTATTNSDTAAAVVDATSPDTWTPAGSDPSPALTLTLAPPADELVGVKVAFQSAVTATTAVTVTASEGGAPFQPVSAPVTVRQQGAGGTGWVYVHFGARGARDVRVGVEQGSVVREVRPLTSGRIGVDVAIAAASVTPAKWDPKGTAKRLVTSDRQAGIFETETIDSPNPSSQAPSLALTLLAPDAIIERVRLTPNVVGADSAARGSGIPTSLQLALSGTLTGETFNWTVAEQTTPIDLVFPAAPTSVVTLTALELGKVLPEADPKQYGFQAADVQVSGFTAKNAPVEVVNAFRTALRPVIAAFDTTNVPHNDLFAVSSALAQAISTASLGGVAWRLLRAEQAFRVAKWGGATLREDPDPAARATGFAVLERTDPRAQTPAPRALEPQPDGELRPLAARGVYGRYLLEAPPAALAQLRDLTVNLRCRACFSPELADSIRGQAADRDRLFEIAGRAVSGATGTASVLLPSGLAAAQGEATRTITVSLRAHRDRTAQAVGAAAAAIGGTTPVTIAGIAIANPSAPPPPLTSDEPFSFLGTQATPGTSLGASFSKSPPTDLASGLPSMPVTLDTLGLPLDLAPILADGTLRAISWAYVPTAKAFYKPLPTLAAVPGGTNASKLAPYLPSPSSGVPILRFGDEPTASPLMTLADLLSDTTLALTFKDSAGNALDAVAQGLVYDVILGVLVELPVGVANP